MSAQKIYFMQHGLAADKADNPERPLSETGIEQTEKIASSLRASETLITSIFHSGKLRAAQTAKIMAAGMNLPTTTMIDGLSPNDDLDLITKKLGISDALYVGHLPHLERLVAHLVCKNEDVTIVKFQNSGVLCLEKKGSHYHVRWLLTPELTE